MQRFDLQKDFIAHSLQQLIAAALQWNVKMRDKPFAIGHKFNDLFRKQIGFNTANSKTINRINSIQNLNIALIKSCLKLGK